MEQPISQEKDKVFFSPKAKVEAFNFFKLAGPMFLSQLALQLIGINSVIQSGNYSSDVLAGILLAGNLWFPLFIGLGGIIFFATPMVAQLFGANKKNEIGAVIWQAMWLVFPIIIIGVSILNNAGTILQYAGVEQKIITHAESYLSTFMFAIPAIMFAAPLRSLSEGIKIPLPISIANIVMLILAIIGNYLFIYGNFGFPEMGAKGAGLSAAIGTWTALIGLIVYMKYRNPEYKETNFFGYFEWPSYRTIKEILIGGLPVGMGNFIELSMFSGAGILLGRLGSDVIAAHGIALSIGGALFMIPLSISIAASVRVGNLIGEGDFRAAKYSSFFSLKIGIFLALFNSLAILIFSEILVNLFTAELEVVALAVLLLKFAAFFQVADGVAMCGIGCLRGYKDTLGPMFILAFSYWLFAMPLGYTLALTDFWTQPLGAPGMWIGICVGLVIASVLIFWRLDLITNKFIKQGS